MYSLCHSGLDPESKAQILKQVQDDNEDYYKFTLIMKQSLTI